jgi:hypothetical protein
VVVTTGRIAAAIAGVTGTGGLGVTTAALVRVTSAHAVPAGLWAALAVLTGAAAAVAALGLLLDYRRGRLEIAARAEDARAQADREKGRLEMYQALVEKAACEPANAAGYRGLILADALHLAVERNGVRPADRTHGLLYDTRGEPDDAVYPEMYGRDRRFGGKQEGVFHETRKAAM